MFAFLAVAASSRASWPGYRVFELSSDRYIDFDLNAGSLTALFLWESEGDDDPQVTITYRSANIQYVRKPVLGSSLAVTGDSVTFRTRGKFHVQVWILPSDLCSVSAFVYSTSIAFVEEFTTTAHVPEMCFFFDNPSTNALIVAEATTTAPAASPKVTIYNSDLQTSRNCTQRRCAGRFSPPLFVRFTSVDAQTRVHVEAHFDGHDTQNICGREAVAFFRGNATAVPRLPTADEELTCDDTFKVFRNKESKLLYLIGAIALGVAIGIGIAVHRRRKKEPLPKRIPKALFDI
jgi:hypothetical protein